MFNFSKTFKIKRKIARVIIIFPQTIQISLQLKKLNHTLKNCEIVKISNWWSPPGQSYGIDSSRVTKRNQKLFNYLKKNHKIIYDSSPNYGDSEKLY